MSAGARRRSALLRRRLRAAVGSSLPETARIARLRWILVRLAALGAVLSVFGALREAGQVRALERRFEQAVDTHLAELQEGLRARAVLIDAVASMFNPRSARERSVPMGAASWPSRRR